MGAIDKLRSSRPVDLLGPGDMISVTIYEDAGHAAAGHPDHLSRQHARPAKLLRSAVFDDARQGRHLNRQRADVTNLQALAADLYGRLTGSDGEIVDTVGALGGSNTC
ncbi:MAG: hypothetical protein ACRYF2_26135 [Janthinobacterium lividum]